jgi:hypothetical protein
MTDVWNPINIFKPKAKLKDAHEDNYRVYVDDNLDRLFANSSLFEERILKSEARIKSLEERRADLPHKTA